MSEIIAPHSLLIAPTVLGEVLWLYSDDERTGRLEVNKDLIGKLHPPMQIADVTDAERAVAVTLAMEMDDGEAETLAVASSRSIRMCTDDHAALRVAPRLSVTTVTTLDLLFVWAKAQQMEDARAALRSLRKRANYAAPRTHQLRDWYIRESAET